MIGNKWTQQDCLECECVAEGIDIYKLCKTPEQPKAWSPTCVVVKSGGCGFILEPKLTILSGQEQSECKLYLSTFSTYKFWIGLLKVQTTTTAVTTTAAVEDVVDNNDSNTDDEDGGEDDVDDVSSLITTTKYETSETYE